MTWTPEELGAFQSSTHSNRLGICYLCSMWRFLRLVLALMLAFFLTIIIGGILLAGILAVGVSLRISMGEKTPIRTGWLHIPLAGEIKEYEEEAIPRFSLLNIFYGSPTQRPPTMEELRRAIAAAAKSDKVKGIILQFADLSAQPAQIQQIARWLSDFKQKAGKPIYAYGDYFREHTYYLATYADTIIMHPRSGSVIEWNGLVAENVFFKRFLEKWGIKPRLFRTGTYKSAAESFTEDHFTEANRVQIEALLGDIWYGIVDTVAQRRKLSRDSLLRWTESRIFLSAEEARAAGLVDTLIPWEIWIRQFVPPKEEKPSFISVSQLLKEKDGGKEARIALLYAEGDIGLEGGIQAHRFVPVIRRLTEDGEVKAVVMRVNSPGGGVLDSDKIAMALKELRAKKPLIVSMSGVAASGGYYISAYASQIVAEPTTITGSIGVIALLFDLRELLEKHIELRTDRVYVGGRYADFMSPYREATPEEIARLQREIEKIYEEFLGVVKEARRYPSLDAVHAIAQGRVWSGEDALRIGLVDTLGGLETAFQLAARAANLDTYSVVVYPKPVSFLERFLKDFQSIRGLGRVIAGAFSVPLPEVFQFYSDTFRIY